ncbi:acyl-CoA dehydrogenase [Acinetobacter sp. 194]|uniref:acyl-CoA dehydrogenase n=1 Tax=Acinetobacter shaoyimingii TaxID=2715164 RepID=UPI001407657F|nr:acyl-CoA dehydrogenase [Acinetobacter shaoyimingii]NHB58983.1 acyl-CoA dehydrogenase [Acinetobacter shaoyimingii]
MDFEDVLSEFDLSEPNIEQELESALKKLVKESTNIPHPAQGQTFLRWQVLAQVSAKNLNLAKWFESHLDSISILQELGYSNLIESNKIYGIWAAEGSPNPVHELNGLISGQKNWCSGAGILDYALITYQNENQQSQLVLIDMHQPNINIDYSAWQAVGMAHTQTASIKFDQVKAIPVGQPNQYLTRVGFWHGAAGVAACWFGATVRIAEFLKQACTTKANDYRLLYLGEMSIQIHMTKQYFNYVATQIDQYPTESHELVIRILRAEVEKTAQLVLTKVGQALGARPYCEDRRFAELTADLTVFMRQSHAAFDLKRIAELTLDVESQADKEQLWTL